MLCVADSVTDCCQETAAGIRAAADMVQQQQVRMLSLALHLSPCSARVAQLHGGALHKVAHFLLDNCCTLRLTTTCFVIEFESSMLVSNGLDPFALFHLW